MMKTITKFEGGFLAGVEIESELPPDCNILIGFAKVSHKPGSGSHTVVQRGLYFLEAKLDQGPIMTLYYIWKSTP